MAGVAFVFGVKNVWVRLDLNQQVVYNKFKQKIILVS